MSLPDSDIPDILRVSIPAIRAHACPVTTPPWDGCARLCPHEVQACLDGGYTLATPVGADCADPQRHAARIAWFLQNGWPDPITIDVGVPWAAGHHDTWIVDDGNHRLYAAIMRGDVDIPAVLGGCLSTAYAMLNIPDPEDSDAH